MNRWLAALQSGAPHAMAQLYADEAAFLPTVSAQFLHGRAAAEAYFAGFLQTYRNCEVTEQCVQWLGEDAYAHSGLYDFRRADADDNHAAARFTFVWRRTAGEWRILHHHSSMQPGAA
ncbi:MAG: SgcJ/EcaC family oxidoreductase [Gammaproteobacteria bacterium]